MMYDMIHPDVYRYERVKQPYYEGGRAVWGNLGDSSFSAMIVMLQTGYKAIEFYTNNPAGFRPGGKTYLWYKSVFEAAGIKVEIDTVEHWYVRIFVVHTDNEQALKSMQSFDHFY